MQNNLEQLREKNNSTIRIFWATRNIYVSIKDSNDSTIFEEIFKRENIKNDQTSFIGKKITQVCLKNGIKSVEIRTRGHVFKVAEPIIKQIQEDGIEIIFIKDITPIPHNACIPIKK